MDLEDAIMEGESLEEVQAMLLEGRDPEKEKQRQRLLAAFRDAVAVSRRAVPPMEGEGYAIAEQGEVVKSYGELFGALTDFECDPAVLIRNVEQNWQMSCLARMIDPNEIPTDATIEQVRKYWTEHDFDKVALQKQASRRELTELAEQLRRKAHSTRLANNADAEVVLSDGEDVFKLIHVMVRGINEQVWYSYSDMERVIREFMSFLKESDKLVEKLFSGIDRGTGESYLLHLAFVREMFMQLARVSGKESDPKVDALRKSLLLYLSTYRDGYWGSIMHDLLEDTGVLLMRIWEERIKIEKYHMIKSSQPISYSELSDLAGEQWYLLDPVVLSEDSEGNTCLTGSAVDMARVYYDHKLRQILFKRGMAMQRTKRGLRLVRFSRNEENISQLEPGEYVELRAMTNDPQKIAEARYELRFQVIDEGLVDINNDESKITLVSGMVESWGKMRGQLGLLWDMYSLMQKELDVPNAVPIYGFTFPTIPSDVTMDPWLVARPSPKFVGQGRPYAMNESIVWREAGVEIRATWSAYLTGLDIRLDDKLQNLLTFEGIAYDQVSHEFDPSKLPKVESDLKGWVLGAIELQNAILAEHRRLGEPDPQLPIDIAKLGMIVLMDEGFSKLYPVLQQVQQDAQRKDPIEHLLDDLSVAIEARWRVIEGETTGLSA